MPASVELLKIRDTLRAAADRQRYRAVDFFKPYEKQLKFMQLGSTAIERLFSAGNQLGKTLCGGAEASYHLTGDYPKDWGGWRTHGPTKGWAAGKSAKDTRDGVQSILCGQHSIPEMFGTGMIPRDAFHGKPSLLHGTPGGYDTITVKRLQPGGGGTVDGYSVVQLKSYDQGRESFQSATLDWIWNDEEPPMDVYSEQLPRIVRKQGRIWITFTPLKGVSEVVRRYLYEPSEHRAVVKMGIFEVGHYTREEAERTLAIYPQNERDARGFGDPLLGEGAIFTAPRELLLIPPPAGGILEVPLQWRKIWGLDFGVSHPFAAVLTAIDLDMDVFYVLHTIKMARATRLQHIPAIRSIASDVPVAWPHDMNQERDVGDADLVKLADLYRNPGPGQLGLNMRPQHATFELGGFSLTAGLDVMQDRMLTNRFKVMDTPANNEWMNEYGAYHRENGKVVKKFDDALSATRQAIMDLRFAKPGPIGPTTLARRTSHFSTRPPINPFTGRPAY